MKIKMIRKNLKLIFSMLLLSVVFSILIFVIAKNEFDARKELVALETKVVLITKISKLLHATQRERGLSAGFVKSQGQKFGKQLSIQRHITDIKIKKFLKHVHKLDTNINDIKKSLNITLNDIKNLKIVRNKIDALTLSSKETRFYYTHMHINTLSLITAITKRSNVSSITQNLIAYNAFLHFKENMGQERAVGTEMFSGTTLSTQDILEFKALIVKQNVYKDEFFQYASTNFKSYYTEHYKGDFIRSVNLMREVVFKTKLNEKNVIDANVWFANITENIELLKKIDNIFTDNIILLIKKELLKNETSLIWFIIYNFIGLIIYFSIIVFVIKLIENEEKQKALINKHIIISTTDINGVITDVNEAYCAISGFSKDELIGQSHNIVRHPDTSKDTFRDLWLTIKDGNPWNGRIQNLHKDKSNYWLDVNVEPLFDSSGKIVSYVAIKHDITDKIDLHEEMLRGREKDKKLLEQSRLAQMGAMISMIAHQWRQPLSAISATTASLKIKFELDSFDLDNKRERDECISYLFKNFSKIDTFVNVLSTTIDDFRNFYKPNKLIVNTSFDEVLKKVLNIIHASLISNNIEVSYEISSQNTFNMFDSEMMQVLLSIFKNSEDNFKDKNILSPKIKVNIHKNCIRVSDNGGGIPSEIINHIFDPYFSTKSEKNGTGLGLYMSKQIIEEHHKGKFFVNNEDEGACFYIEISKEL
ncbi:nitrate- and nitrite sensing domain-containing protein [Sulfurimonas sp. MAG313]|nr:nitrate- and nitrite sensing domain-containing protein [Sulfurimonas sp. MAG313]MDF1880202.1 nitrate- and nitrite sensing domain-containing protein [Sulfurimonas sp. MAG313]